MLFTLCFYVSFVVLVFVTSLVIWELGNRQVRIEKEKQKLADRARLGANVADIAHDIRNLTTSQILLIQVLQQFVSNKEDLVLVDDALQQSKCAQSYLSLLLGTPDVAEDISLLAMTKKVARLYGSGLQALIKIEPSTIVYCSPLGLERLLGNLVSNAAKHGTGSYIRFIETPGSLWVENRVDAPLPISAWTGDCEAKTVWEGLGLRIVKGLAQKLNIGLSFEHVEHEDGLWLRFIVEFGQCLVS